MDFARANRLHSSAMPRHASHILELAARGAKSRYDELKAELAALVTRIAFLMPRT